LSKWEVRVDHVHYMCDRDLIVDMYRCICILYFQHYCLLIRTSWFIVVVKRFDVYLHVVTTTPFNWLFAIHMPRLNCPFVQRDLYPGKPPSGFNDAGNLE
jgi:hypothetical protein